MMIVTIINNITKLNTIKLATIYRSKQTPKLTGNKSSTYPTLRIDGRNVGFLIDVLREKSTFSDINDSIWRVDFFETSPFRQVFYISVGELSPQGEAVNTAGRKQIADHLKKATYEQILPYLDEPREVVKACFIQTGQYELDEEVILTASQLIRGTDSMKFDKAAIERHSDRFIHVDGRGTVLMSPDSLHKATFKRQTLLLALSKAYLLAMNEIMNGLAMKCEDSEALRELYKDSLIFNAKYYFANPVKVNRYDAFQLWQGIRCCMKIDDINNEVTQQLKAVHHILSEEEEAAQFKSELRLNKKIGWLGVAIGVFSLVSLFEITPAKVSSFFNTWLTFFTSG